MNKKILAILALLIFVTSITAVSAFDLGSLFGGEDNETVSIGGIDFNIPAGFKEDPTHSTNKLVDPLKEMGVNVTGKGYEKDSTAVLIIVANYSDVGISDDEALSGFDGNNTTINGVDGIYEEDSGDSCFGYTKDKCLVLVTSNDKNVIGDFLIA